MDPVLQTLLNRLSRRAEIPRQAWTTDRWGRFLAGCGIVFFLGFGLAFGDAIFTPWTVLAGCVGLQLTVTSLIGWCPFHELLKLWGVKDREEVFAEELRAGVRQVKGGTCLEAAPFVQRKSVRLENAGGRNRRKIVKRRPVEVER